MAVGSRGLSARDGGERLARRARMRYPRGMTSSDSPIDLLRRDCRAIFDAAVAAVQPQTFLPQRLPPVPKHDGRIIVLAAGKAAGSMARVAERHYLGLGMPPERLSGLAVARHGYGAALERIVLREAGHPVPDEGSVAGAEDMLARAEDAGRGDLVLFLLSGGASANLVAPAAGVTLAEKQALTRALLASGATIGEINTVRRHLSRIKGGRLAASIAPARLVTIALSDVPQDELAAIGSGPTVPDPTTLAEARAILQRYAIFPAPSIRAALEDPANETLKPGDPAFGGTRAMVAASPADGFAGAVAEATRLGYRVIDLGADLQGEAREVAKRHAAVTLAEARTGKRIALMSGGELTVTLSGKPAGRGGPNQEYALALAIGLEGAPRIVALAGDTDGTDGGSGKPDDPAGAFVDPGTLARAEAKGAVAARFLQHNDSTGFFTLTGDLLTTGPTLTNANDLRVILIGA